MASWHPEAADAVAFATLRWHANRLENLAIDLYVTDKDRFRDIVSLLKEAAGDRVTDCEAPGNSAIPTRNALTRGDAITTNANPTLTRLARSSGPVRFTKGATMARNWKHHENNAVEFATLRWHANRLENQAIQLYVTDRNNFSQIADIFKQAAKDLKTLHNSCTSDDDCPDSWHCNNGECQPDN